MQNRPAVLVASLALLATSITPVSADEVTGRGTEALVFNCFTCHGTDGRSPGEMPGLNGKSAAKIKEKLLEFRQDLGEPTIMNRIAKGYSEEEIERIAQFMATLK